MSLDIRQKVQDFVRERPEYLLYKESEILSIMEEEGRISAKELESAKSTSAFGYGFSSDNFNEFEPVFKNRTVIVKASREEKEQAADFIKEYLKDASQGAKEVHEKYLEDYGPLDATWNIIKNIANRFDFSENGNKLITLEEMDNIVQKELKFAQRVNDSQHLGVLEVAFERERGINFDAKKVLDFKEKSDAYLVALASKEKYELLQNGLKELREIYRKEQSLERLQKLGQNVPQSAFPSISFDEKLVEILDAYCEDEETRNAYITQISEGIASKEELKEKFLNVLSDIEIQAEKLYKEQLGGKSFAQYELEYQKAYQSTLGGENPKDMVEGWVNRQKQGAQFVKMAAIIATTTLTGGSNLVATGQAKLMQTVGTNLAKQIVKLGMTSYGVGVGVALDYANAIGSQTGLTDEKNQEILTNAKHMLPYAFFGAYVSGPLGDKIASALKTGGTNAVMPKILDNAFSKGATSAGFASEVGLDVLFELAISNGELVDVITGNATGEAQGRMLNNFFQMLIGGRAHGASKIAIQNALKQAGLADCKVAKTEDGKFELISPNGQKQKFDSVEEIVAGTIAKTAEVTSGAKVEEVDNVKKIDEETKIKNKKQKNSDKSENKTNSAKKVDIAISHTETVKGKAGQISIIAKDNSVIGVVNYDCRVVNGEKVLHFEGLDSKQQGLGIGTKLIQELVQKSKELGADGRLVAQASPAKAVNGKVTNLGFYYKLGFKAVDEQKNAKIEEYINNGKEIPLELNVFTDIYLTKDAINGIASKETNLRDIREKNVSKKQKEKRELDATLKQQVKDEVVKIRTKYNAIKDRLTTSLSNANFDKVGNFFFRVKGEQSLHDKLANYLKENPKATIIDALKDVRDAYACRTIVENKDLKNHPDVQKLLKAGDERGAILKAAELQSEPAVAMLKDLILEEAAGKSDFFISRISNYVSEDGIPYFSEAQLAELKQFADKNGVHIDFVKQIPKTDPKYEQLKANGYKPTTKAQPSGYTALQMNFKTKNGEVFEWQFRGEKVNVFAEGEHIVYDLRTNKDIIGDNKELEPLYEPMKKLLDEDNMPEAVYNSYNEYLTDYYVYFRRQELGFDAVKPKLEDYQVFGYKFDKLLDAESLMKLHDVAEKVKQGLISGEDAKIYIDNFAQKGFDQILPMKKDEFAQVMKNLGYSDYDIAKIDLSSPDVQAIVLAFIVKNENIKPDSIEFDKEFLEELQYVEKGDTKDMKLEFVTKNNVEYLKKYVDVEDDASLILDIVQNNHFQSVYPMLKDLGAEQKLSVEEIKILLKMGLSDYQYITKERLAVFAQIAEGNNKLVIFNGSDVPFLDMCIKKPELLENKYTRELIQTCLSPMQRNHEVNMYVDDKFTKNVLQSLERLSNLNLDSFTRFTLASMKNLDETNQQGAINFIKAMQTKLDDSFASGLCISKFVHENSKIDLKDFTEYLKNVDLNKIKKENPKMNDFTKEEIVTFLKYHYLNDTKDFSAKNLSLSMDFTTFLAKCYLGEDVGKLLTVFPNTNRNIGSLPDGWVKDIEKEPQVNTDVRNAIESFRAKVSTMFQFDSNNAEKTQGSANVTDLWLIHSKAESQKKKIEVLKFQLQLSSILQKDVKVVEIGSGSFGTGFKIEVAGAQPVVLKIFHGNSFKGNEHGQWAEVARGPFLNTHSNDFAHFYFGKVPSNHDTDGFLVTEFLDNTGVSNFQGNQDPDYKIISNDDYPRNRRGGKIIDYGAVKVIPQGDTKPLTFDDLFRRRNIDKK